MRRQLFPLVFIMTCALLGGCQPSDPQAALAAAVQQLQDNLEHKQTAAVLEQLHPQFRAQQEFDRDWAKRTMLLLFMRHKQVQVLALSKDSQLDPSNHARGYTLAHIALTGAEGLLPDSAGQYQVRLEWWLEDGEWRLARLHWE